MPRPGPRPYECVRRAWHSDRHQPMRGSIIQQIFRVVNDAHSSTTRKNREWQEKLPTVVLKAEEIMYSKANSEAEYMEHDTLWDRLTDAIDTIIRRDESGESGECLQPCIEAALILGCTPVRASRSQRYCNPKTYLTPKVQEQQTSVAPVVSDMSNAVRPPPQRPDPSGSQLGTLRPAMGNHANYLMNQNYCHIAAHNPPFFHTHYPPTMVSSEPVESKRSFKLGSVYPLYYGTQLHKIEPQFSIPLQQNLNPNNVIIGRPVGWTVTEPSRSGTTKNLFPSESAEHASLRFQQENLVSAAGVVSGADCDLSLRLGPVLDPHVSYETKHGASRHCQEDKKFPMPSSSNHELCFFPRQNADDISHSQSGKWAFRGDVQHVNATMRKRKATFHHDAEDGHTLWQSELRTNNIGQTRGRGL